MPNAYISGTGFYVPPRVVTNTMLRTEYGIDTTEEWIVKRTGIEERRYSEPGVATSDLAVPAAEDAIRRAGITKQDIDMILFATLSPDAAFPGCGVYLQQKLGLCDGDDATFVPAMDIRNQCSGFVYSLATATSMVKSGAMKNVLVVGAETHSAAIDLSDRGRTVASLFGDGAGAVVVSATDEDRGVRGWYLGADGRHADALRQQVWDIRERPFIPLGEDGWGRVSPAQHPALRQHHGGHHPDPPRRGRAQRQAAARDEGRDGGLRLRLHLGRRHRRLVRGTGGAPARGAPVGKGDQIRSTSTARP
jgi:3-oxoacyl-[acyl-carrier-protein] synthase-3